MSVRNEFWEPEVGFAKNTIEKITKFNSRVVHENTKRASHENTKVSKNSDHT